MELVVQGLVLASLSVLVLGLGDYCINPSGGYGICVFIEDCESLRTSVLESTRHHNHKILQELQCGLRDKKPMICCPTYTNTTIRQENKFITTRGTYGTTTVTTITTTTKIITSANNYTNTELPADIDCITLEGEFGACIELIKCSNIADKLVNPTENNLDYVFRSRCIGSAPYSVCCVQKEANSESPNIYIPHTLGALEGNEYVQEVFNQTFIRDSTNKCTPSALLPDPNGECCGKETRTESKTSEGVASIYQYPWMALLEYSDKNKSCIGFLITSQHVLTAAQCLYDEKKHIFREVESVILGDYNVTNDGPDCVELDGGGRECTSGAISIPVASASINREFNKNYLVLRADDIGLVELTKMAPYNEFIRPICLPKSDMTVSPPPGLRFFVAGWGAVDDTQKISDVKLHVDLPYYDMTRCQERYSHIRDGLWSLWDKQLCAGGELNVGSCKGDAGGPLMYFDGSKFEVVGINSFGFTKCGSADKPDIYTKVYKYRSWIEETINPFEASLNLENN